MFIFLLLLLPALAPLVTQLVEDPAPGLWRSKQESRNLDCERADADSVTLRARHPGVIEPDPPRGAYMRRDAVLCRERIMGAADRLPRDEAVLAELAETSQRVAAAVGALVPQLARHVWAVEAFYPNPEVAAKVAFAAKAALMDRGRRVTDRVPMLTAGDIEVLSSLPPFDAYPLACRRYRDLGSLGPGEALLVLMLLNDREGILHSGVCVEGAWQWLP